MKLEIIDLTKEHYKAWDDFCLKSNDAWFWHTSDWIEMNLLYKPELNPVSKSFFVKKGKDILAVVPLFLEKYNEDENNFCEFSLGSGYNWNPCLRNDLSADKKDSLLKFIFSYIDELAKCHGVMRTRIRIAPLAMNFLNAEFIPFNYLLKFGYIDNSLSTQILDLRRPLDKIWSEVRKGHNYDIDRAKKKIIVEIYHKDNISRNIYDQYCQMHHRDAGRITRSQVTFDLWYEWLEKGNAVLVAAKKDNEYIGFSLFITYKNAAYYGSSCNEPAYDYEKLPIGHLIQWEIIQWLKKNNFDFYEIGWQQFGAQLFDFPSQKEIDIAKFKRGFGGLTVPLYAGEKFYSKDFFLKIYGARLNKYADFL